MNKEETRFSMFSAAIGGTCLLTSLNQTNNLIAQNLFDGESFDILTAFLAGVVFYFVIFFLYRGIASAQKRRQSRRKENEAFYEDDIPAIVMVAILVFAGLFLYSLLSILTHFNSGVSLMLLPLPLVFAVSSVALLRHELLAIKRNLRRRIGRKRVDR